MKKIILAAFVLSVGMAHAQTDETPNKFKHFYVNAGADFTDYNLTKNAYLGLEYRLKDESSLGVNLFYKDVPYDSGYSVYFGTNYGFQLQANHDWSSSLGLNTDKFDVYTGLNAGMTFQNLEQRNVFFGNQFGPRNDVKNTSINVGGQLGIRYFIFKNIGIHLEANTNQRVSGDRFDLGPNPRHIELRTGLTFKF